MPIAEGDLSERARRRAMELANDADVRLMPPKDASAASTADAEDTLPKVRPAERQPPDSVCRLSLYLFTSHRVTLLD